MNTQLLNLQAGLVHMGSWLHYWMSNWDIPVNTSIRGTVSRKGERRDGRRTTPGWKLTGPNEFRKHCRSEGQYLLGMILKVEVVSYRTDSGRGWVKITCTEILTNKNLTKLRKITGSCDIGGDVTAKCEDANNNVLSISYLILDRPIYPS